MKEEVLKKILDKINKCEEKSQIEGRKFIVDRIDVIALKELYNDILKL